MDGSTATREALLEIRDLRLSFETYRGVVNALEGIDLVVYPGEALGVVGETGCGKSVTARAAMGFVEPPGRVDGGEVLFQNRNLLTMAPEDLRRLRGKEISFVFQEAKKALDPTATVGSQIIEAVQISRGLRRRAAQALARDTLAQVGLADAERVMRSYAFELSGGMAQRVMIAIAVVGGSKLLIADEPTSALDVSIQGQILALLADIRARTGAALMLITHDLGVAAENCDRIAVMYAGRVVESGDVIEVFRRPAHPYTAKLLRALPLPGVERLAAIPGSVPDLVDAPPGCRFANRCDRVKDVCRLSRPEMVALGQAHFADCHRPLDASVACLEPVQ